MKKRFPLLILLLLALLMLTIGTPTSRADADARFWTLEDAGRKFHASLVEVDPEGNVRLRQGDTVTSYRPEAFSAIDQAWLADWAERNREFDEIVAQAPGQLTRHVVTGEFTTEYYVYEPSEAGAAEQRPVLLLFNPGGKAQQYIKRFVMPAEGSKMMIITLGYFHNTEPHDPEGDAKEVAMTRRFGEVWADIQQKVPFDAARVFMGGTSGGAPRAYSYLWKFPRPWAGVWSNGGWMGGRKAAAHDFPDNMRVVFINGHQDRSSNAYITQDTNALLRHNAKVGVISFEGGHQMPPQDKITQSLHWLLGNEAAFEEQ